MYTPESFSVDDQETIRAIVERYPFATLVTSDSGSPTVTHLPLSWSDDADTPMLVGHVARANPHWRAFESAEESLAIFHGPHAYVSPTWYETEVAVPTWNYIVVHAHGRLQIVDDRERVDAALAALVERYESPRPEPWSGDLPDDLRDKLVAAIVLFEMPVTRWEAKCKLSQNRSEADQRGMIAGLLREAGTAGEELARWSEWLEAR